MIQARRKAGNLVFLGDEGPRVIEYEISSHK